MKVKDHTKLKEPFVASGIPHQRIFVPMLFPSQNEWLRMAGATYRVGKRHQRGSEAQDLKNTMENKIQVYIRLANLKPMEQVFFFFTFFEVNRQRNKDNIQSLAMKFFLDALQKERIIQNDGWKEIVGWDPHFEVAVVSAGMLVDMYDPFQCRGEIITKGSERIIDKLDQYDDFRKRTSR